MTNEEAQVSQFGSGVKPGCYADISMEEYLAMPAVSASLLKIMLTECPRAAWYQSWLNPNRPVGDDTKVSDAGSIAHGILLEGSTAGVEVIDPQDHPAEKTGNIPDGWTNKSIRAARDAARAAGKIPVLAPAMIEINAMVDAAKAYIESVRRTEPVIWAAFQPDGGDSEMTLVWEEAGTKCRIRPDRIATDRTLIVDYKTGGTTAEPNTWARRQMVTMGYYISAAWYRRGVYAVFETIPDYVFLVQEQAPPYLCSLVGIDPAGYDLGSQKVDHAFSMWQSCAREDVWPAFPNRVCYAELPPWEASRWEEQQLQTMETHGIAYDPSKLWEKTP